jgi:hypothetical protein
MIEARRVLLDALEALGDHRESLVLVGAQAVYLTTGEIDLSFSASFTTDADVAVDPATLAQAPPIEQGMIRAGFERVEPDRPGIWGKHVVVGGRDEIVQVDLIVPESLAGPGRRGARLVGHSKQAAGRADGLEAAVVDRDPMEIRSYDSTDKRTMTVDVAGPTALLVAKLHKLSDRALEADRRPDRLIAKDAADSYRLMLHLGVDTAVTTFRYLADQPIASAATGKALEHLRSLFAAPALVGVKLAVEGLASDLPSDRVEAVCVDFTRGVLEQL